MKKFISLVFAAIVSLSFASLCLAPATASAACPIHAKELNVGSLPCGVNTDDNSLIKTALSFVFGVLGAVCLVIITLAGFKYTISRGDPAGMAKSKNTILYAVIGLAVAASAQLIVSFVINRVTG